MIYHRGKNKLAFKYLLSRGYWFAALWSLDENKLTRLSKESAAQHPDESREEVEARAIFRHVALKVRHPHRFVTVPLVVVIVVILILFMVFHGR